MNAVPGRINFNVRNHVGLPEAPRALDQNANTPTNDAPPGRIGNVATTEAKVATTDPHARMTVPFLATNDVDLRAHDRVAKTNDADLLRMNAAHMTNVVGRLADDRVVRTNDVDLRADAPVVKTNDVDLAPMDVDLAPMNAAHATNDVDLPADAPVVRTNDVDLVRLDRMAVTNAEDVVTNMRISSERVRRIPSKNVRQLVMNPHSALRQSRNNAR